jgi:hypothetical protein
MLTSGASTADAVDVDDDILATAQVNRSLVESGGFVARFKTKADAATAVRDLLAGADAVVEVDEQAHAAYEFTAAAVSAIEQCFHAQVEIAPSLHEVALKRFAAAARAAFGPESAEVAKAQRLLASFQTRLKPVSEKPATVEQASFFSPLGLRCWNQGCRQSSNAHFMNCARCRIALYCGPDCQKTDWNNGHKAQCKAFVAAQQAKAAATVSDPAS